MKKTIGSAALAIAISLAVGLSSCASAYFYDVAIARKPKGFVLSLGDKKGPSGKRASPSEVSWIRGKAYETVSIASEDGLKLTGYYLPAEDAGARTVILAHGYAGRGFDMSGFAKFYHEKLGYNVLMPDARGHGASEGDYIGFGWTDRLDYVGWIEWAISRAGKDARIALHGISMGGATVLMASGEDLPPNVRAIIEDCGYTSVDEQLSYQLKAIYRLGREPIVPATSRLTKKRAGWSFEEASALAQVMKSRTPTLFIHGDADDFVPFEMALRLYEACAADKELFVVHGAGHGESAEKDPEGYMARVAAFLAMRVDGLPAPPVE